MGFDPSEILWSVNRALTGDGIPMALAVEYEHARSKAWSDCTDAEPMLALVEHVDARLAMRIVAVEARKMAEREGDRYDRSSLLDALDDVVAAFNGSNDVDPTQHLAPIQSIVDGAGTPTCHVAMAVLDLLWIQVGDIAKRRAYHAFESVGMAHAYKNGRFSNGSEEWDRIVSNVTDVIRSAMPEAPSVADLMRGV